MKKAEAKKRRALSRSEKDKIMSSTKAQWEKARKERREKRAEVAIERAAEQAIAKAEFVAEESGGSPVSKKERRKVRTGLLTLGGCMKFRTVTHTPYDHLLHANVICRSNLECECSTRKCSALRQPAWRRR